MIIAVATLGFSACVGCGSHSIVIDGNGVEASGVFDISLTYNELTVREGIRVVLVESDVEEGHIVADEAIIRYVSIVERDGRVVVDYRNNISGIVSTEIETVVTLPISPRLAEIHATSAAQVATAYVLTVPRMEIDASSAATVNLNVEASELDVDVSSAAKCYLSVVCSSITADVTGAAQCSMSGAAHSLEVDSESAANFDGFALECNDVRAETSSAASIEITVIESLEARATSGGSIRYKGSPTHVKEDESSGGSIRHVD